MTGIWKSSASWRATLTWALLGPLLVLIVEGEAALGLLDAIGGLPRDLRGWQAIVAGAVLAVVIGAQLSVGLSRSLAGARHQLSERRETRERELASAKSRALAKTTEKTEAEALPDQAVTPPPPPPLGQPKASGSIFATRRLRRMDSGLSKDPDDSVGARRILERFGLDPSWAFRQLDENLGVPAARQLTRRAQLAAARWAGHLTALIFACVGFLSAYAWIFIGILPALNRASTPFRPQTAHTQLGAALVFMFFLVILGAGQYYAARTVAGAVIRNETDFYPQVETVLELHRFDLYRALAVPLPRDSSEEENGRILAWRLSSGSVSFEPDETRDDPEVRQQVAGLTELLRGPELVGYEGFVSWTLADEHVELALARAPVLDGGNARLQVEGSSNASHAPFDITADSEDVTLIKVRNTINAPVSGDTVRTTFNFQRRAEARKDSPELWFEISQRGRFVQLLRVGAPRPSAPTETG